MPIAVWQKNGNGTGARFDLKWRTVEAPGRRETHLRRAICDQREELRVLSLFEASATAEANDLSGLGHRAAPRALAVNLDPLQLLAATIDLPDGTRAHLSASVTTAIETVN